MLPNKLFTGSIWVERDRYHTALVLDADLINVYAPKLSHLLNGAPFIRFGWGDREYYGSTTQSFYKAFKALILPTRSVVEVTTLQDLSECLDNTSSSTSHASRDLIAIAIRQEQIQAIVQFISMTFKWDKEESLRLLREEASGARYYCARGMYHGLRNCNNWTAKALKKGHVKIRYRCSITAGSVMKQL